jgi:hypothetical protein
MTLDNGTKNSLRTLPGLSECSRLHGDHRLIPVTFSGHPSCLSPISFHQPTREFVVNLEQSQLALQREERQPSCLREHEPEIAREKPAARFRDAVCNRHHPHDSPAWELRWNLDAKTAAQIFAQALVAGRLLLTDGVVGCPETKSAVGSGYGLRLYAVTAMETSARPLTRARGSARPF